MRFFIFLLPAFLFVAIYPLTAQWAPAPSIPETDVYALFAGENTWYAATDDIIFKSNNSGVNWTELPASPQGLTALYADEEALYAGTLDQGVYRSFNGGQNWQQLSGGLGGIGAKSITCFLSRGDSLLAGTEGGVYLIRKSDTAPQWQNFSQGLSFNSSYSINALAFTGSAFLAGAGANGNLYRRGINETAWQAIPIANPFSSGLTAYSFANAGGKLYAGTYMGVFQSTDGGFNWQLRPGALPFSTKLLFAHQGKLLAITNRLEGSALYSSSDEGASWELLGAFPGANSYGLVISDEHIFLANQFGLLWAPVDIISETDEPGQLESSRIQNLFPNPASGQARLTFSLDRGTDVKAGLFDNTGRLVRSFSSAYFPAGTHEMEIYLEGLPAGVYVLRGWFGVAQESRLLVVR